MTEPDPLTFTGVDGAPNLAVDLQAAGVEGEFTLDVDHLDSSAELGWAASGWVNVACDVTRLGLRRGATRMQGVLTRAEAAAVTVEVLDTDRRFDPLVNADAVHAGTPVRVRAWGEAPTLVPVTARTNLATDPRATALLPAGGPGLGWGSNRWFGGGSGTHTFLAGRPDGPPKDPARTRRNMAHHPDHGDVTFTTGTVGTVTRTDVTADPITVPGRGEALPFRRTASSGLGTVQTDRIGEYQRIPGFAPGDQLRASVYVRRWAGSTGKRIRLRVDWANAGGATVTSAAGSAVVTPTDNGVIRLSCVPNAATHADTRQAIVFVWAEGTDGGAIEPFTFDHTAILVERGSAPPGDYFDGDSGAGYVWEGAPRASASLHDPSPLGVSTYVRKQWTTAATSNADTGFQNGFVNGPPLPVVPGEVYTLSSYLRPSSAKTLYMRAVFYKADGTASTENYKNGPFVTATAGEWTRISHTVTVPADAAFMISLSDVRALGALWVAGETLDGTALLVERSGTIGDYFDGDTADEPLAEGARLHAWTGAPNAGTSVQQVATTLVAPWSSVLFTGELDDVPVTYDREGPPRVTLFVSDVIAELAGWRSVGRPEPGVGQGDDLLERVARVLDEVQRADALADPVDLDTGYTASHPATLLDHAWPTITDAADAELGRVWANRDNRLVVRARGSQLDGPIRGTLSDWHGEEPWAPHVCYSDLGAALGTELLNNRTVGQRRNPPGVAGTPAVVQRDDPASQARHRLRVNGGERRDLDLETDAQVEAWCEYVLVETSVPELRIDSVQPAPWSAGAAAWRAVCETDLGDRWAVRYHPTVGDPVVRMVGVLGIALDVSPDGWQITWATAPAPTPGENPSGWVALDVSVLDSGDLLATFGGPVPALEPVS